MSRDDKYYSLYKDCQRAEAEIKYLQERRDALQKAIEEEEASYHVTEMLIRDLCMQILGKDRNYASLDTDFSVYDQNLPQMLRDAKDSYLKYNKKMESALVSAIEKTEEQEIHKKRLEEALKELQKEEDES